MKRLFLLFVVTVIVSLVGSAYGEQCGVEPMMGAQTMEKHHQEMMMSTETSHCPMRSTMTARGEKMKEIPVEVKSKKSAAKPAVSDFQIVPSAYGRMVSCPVRGNKFKITRDTPAAKYKNKEYYFCCPACLEQFKKDPEKYLPKEKNKK